jgi:hypothetical protein
MTPGPFPAFGIQIGDSLRADGRGGTMTEAQYEAERRRRRGVKLREFTDAEAQKHIEDLRTKGIIEE